MSVRWSVIVLETCVGSGGWVVVTWSCVALIVRISLWVIIQVLIVRMFLAAVVLDVD